MNKLDVIYNGKSYSCGMSQSIGSVIISNKEEGQIRILFSGNDEENRQVQWLATSLSAGDRIKIRIVENDGKMSENLNPDSVYLKEYYELKDKLGK